MNEYGGLELQSLEHLPLTDIDHSSLLSATSEWVSPVRRIDALEKRVEELEELVRLLESRICLDSIVKNSPNGQH